MEEGIIKPLLNMNKKGVKKKEGSEDWMFDEKKESSILGTVIAVSLSKKHILVKLSEMFLTDI